MSGGVQTARERPLPFAALTLDRRDEWRTDAERLRALWAQARIVMVDFEGRAPGSETTLHVLPMRAVGHGAFAQASFLGMQGDDAWFALPAETVDAPTLSTIPGWVGLREAAARWSAFDSGLFAYAKALLLWQSRARHCGSCGAPTALVRAGHCARCTNPECKLDQFPRTDAAVIVIVVDGVRCLLGRQSGWPGGRYSTLAGFVEPGEALEDAVRREVREESGVRVGACHYRGSQPWPFPGALMVGFRAEATDATIRLGDELEDARWFEAAELVAAVQRGEIGLPPRISISRRLIEDWLTDTLGSETLAGLRSH